MPHSNYAKVFRISNRFPEPTNMSVFLGNRWEFLIYYNIYHLGVFQDRCRVNPPYAASRTGRHLDDLFPLFCHTPQGGLGLLLLLQDNILLADDLVKTFGHFIPNMQVHNERKIAFIQSFIQF